jgi:Zn-dependent peptidase ImmA (M78 family)
MNTVSIKPEILRWALERAGLDIPDLASAFPKLAEWEQGVSSPTLNQLEKLAKRLWAPLGYFFLPSPPEETLPIPDFRSIGDEPIQSPSPNLLETLFSMQRRQAWLKEFRIEEGAEPLGFVGSASLRDKPEAVAAQMRNTLGMATDKGATKWGDAFSDLWINTERAGATVVCSGIVGYNTSRLLDVEEFRGFVLSDSIAPLVFINNADAKAAQMFTLAHELAHLWINSPGVLNFREMRPAENPTELFCNAVAAEFLVPKNQLAAKWAQLDDFFGLASYFKVSPLVIARRLLDANYINKARFFSFYNTYMAKMRTDKASTKERGGNFYSSCDYRIGRPFADAVGRAVKGGRLLYRDAFQLTGLQGKTFDKYVFRSGGFEAG